LAVNARRKKRAARDGGEGMKEAIEASGTP
jgi:hypothetical protein